MYFCIFILFSNQQKYYHVLLHRLNDTTNIIYSPISSSSSSVILFNVYNQEIDRNHMTYATTCNILLGFMLKYLTDVIEITWFRLFAIIFLAPPAKWQWSFSNADSSVVCRRHLSSTFHLNGWFLKNGLITFFLFWHGASLGRYWCTVKIWIWLNHPKCHFKRSERSNLAPFLLGGNFLKNCLITFFSILSWSFPRRVLMDCQEMDLIESL